MILVASPAELFIAAVVGLILGSFATALVYRIPAGLSWYGADPSVRRSVCVHCSSPLRIRDLVPVFSWLLRKGRCGYCQAPIGFVYPLIEILVMSAIVFYIATHGFFPLQMHVPAVLAMPILIALFIIDLRTRTLPNSLVLIFFILGLLHCVGTVYGSDFVSSAFYEYIGGGFFYGLLALGLSFSMEKFLQKPALGGGDIKLMAACGLWLGLSNLANFFMLSGFLGVVLGVLWRWIKHEPVFPFGPALILSFYVLFLL